MARVLRAKIYQIDLIVLQLQLPELKTSIDLIVLQQTNKRGHVYNFG